MKRIEVNKETKKKHQHSALKVMNKRWQCSFCMRGFYGWKAVAAK
ncbi:hypothetical protein BATR1942_01870 [Bacillus atrophaeus 1942]|uniref:Uncharacterized protein n=1 Tax=Bacillus atrophaeus (strain 1942) TaxID=720555 RepID=A0ABM5LU18_BACA1|nr:hypothetical protein BATR1942_01870 [Bacillus atrophaeus 1942]EIM09130.1 hypothetical protein UY9_19144 [Bacillus atrophaeus C89]KYD00708.1 hypothetical protein B4144_0886 [Bacillus atrophaeus]